MKHITKLILALTTALGSTNCYSGIYAIQDVTPTSANLVIKEQPDCSSSGYIHFEYNEEKTARVVHSVLTTQRHYLTSSRHTSIRRLKTLRKVILDLQSEYTVQ